MLPGGWNQLLVVALFILPGFVYQATRSRLRGPSPDDRDATVRVLRALGVSVVLGLSYMVAVGPIVVSWSADPRSLLEAPRQAALVALILLFALPLALGVGGHALHLSNIGVLSHWWHLRPHHLNLYDTTPTAWDFALRNREEHFVRVLTADNEWIGGFAAEESFATAYPEPRELYIQAAYVMNNDGSFGSEVNGTVGMWIRCDDAKAIQFLRVTAGEADSDAAP